MRGLPYEEGQVVESNEGQQSVIDGRSAYPGSKLGKRSLDDCPSRGEVHGHIVG
jgi:hypothetical protein